MKPFSLFDTEYSLSPRGHEFLSQYLTRVERYISRKSLDPSYLDDLKLRMKEKLEVMSLPIEEKALVGLVNELGEPEDIFADIESTPKVEEDEGSPWFLSRKKKIIFWVALRLSEDLHIPVVYVRLIFILLVFVYTIGIWIYFALALLLPNIFWKERKTASSPSAFTVIGGKVFRIILVLFLSIIVLWCLILGTIWLIWALNLWTPWIIDHQDVLAVLSPIFRVAALIFFLCLILIWLSLGAYAYGKPILWRYSWLSLTFIYVVSGAVALSTVVRIMAGYIQESRTTQTFSSPLWSWVLDIVVEYPDTSMGIMGNRLRDEAYRYITSRSGITVTVDTILRSTDTRDLAERLSSLNPYDIRLEGNRLTIRPPQYTFRDIVPLSFPSRIVTIALPESMLVQQDGNILPVNTFRTRLEDFTPWARECEMSHYIFSKKRGKFLCDPRWYRRDILESAMEQYARIALQEGILSEVTMLSGVVASGSFFIYPENLQWESTETANTATRIDVHIDDEGNMFAQKRASGTTGTWDSKP